MGRRAVTVVWGVLALSGAVHAGDALRVAISEDIPPYVTDAGQAGAEVEIVRGALKGRTLRFVQLPYAELQTAVAQGRADVSVGVQRLGDGIYSVRDVIGFENYAISRRADRLRIDDVDDLAGHRLLTWQGAWRELGPDFARLFGPQGPERARYVEIADQAQQVRRFWEEPGSVAVIDGTIFRWFTRAMGRASGDAVFHAIFPPVTDFAVAFGSRDLRDAFDDGLDALCTGGAYADILRRWDVVLRRSVCDAG